MLLGKNARRQRLPRVGFKHRDHALGNDWPTIQRLIYKMDGAAGPFHTMAEGLLLRFKTGKGRQEAGMNIQNAIAKGLDKGRRNQTHVTSQTNKIDPMMLQDGD